MTSTERWTVEAETDGERLDLYLARRFEVARNRAQHWIRDGAVRVDGAPAKPSLKLVGGELVECEPHPVTQPEELEPEPGELSILHEDDDVVVIDKPADLVVHPGAGRDRGTLAHRLLARYPEIAAVGGPGRPGIVHRLDRDTTGALVVARTPAAYAALTRAFAERRIEKSYLAVVYGRPSPESGVFDDPIGRHPVERKKMTVTPRGRSARTGYRTVTAAAGISLLELDLETGRTHQIRVHLKAHRCPLVGDPVYGEARWRGLPNSTPLRRFARPALHAWRICFPHPSAGETVSCEAPVPEDLSELWRKVTGEAWPTPEPAA